jgi:erythromycin esterase
LHRARAHGIRFAPFILALCASCQGSEAALAAWIEREAIELEQPDDLEPLVERAAGRRLILLGEATHGTEEFYAWRREITEALVRRGVVDFVAVEGDWAGMLELNLWVKGVGPYADDAADAAGRKLVAGLDRWPVWMWSNEQTLELATFLRRFNATRPAAERVGLYGLDLYSPERAMAEVLRWLGQHRPDSLGHGGRGCLGQASARRASYRHEVRAGRGCKDELEALIGELRELPDDDEEAARDRFVVLETLKSARQAHRHFAAEGVETWNTRAGHFFDVTARLLEHYGEESAGVVWAHNTHIGDGRATGLARSGRVNLGMLARQELGAGEVFAVGFGTDRGEVLAAERWGAPVQVMSIAPAQSGSFDAYLRAHGPAQHALLLDGALPRRLQRAIPHRAIGVVWEGEDTDQNYVPSEIGARYDAFIWIEETTALVQLEPRP